MEFTKEQIETRKREILDRLEELKDDMNPELYNGFLEDITDDYIISLLKYDSDKTPEHEYSDDVIYTSREEALKINKELEKKGYSSSDDGFKFE